MTHPISEKSADEIRAWILSQVATELGIDAGEIKTTEPLTRYGMDSMTAVVLTGELEHWLGRPVPADLLGRLVTIESLAQHLSNPARPQSHSAKEPPDLDESEVEPAPWEFHPPTFFQRLIRRITVRLVTLLIRIDVDGLDHVPAAGPFILACNHLHIIDAPVLVSVMPGSTVFFVSDHMLEFPLVGWYMRQLGQSIYVARRKADREALGNALAVLRAGGTLAIAPEGRISRTRGLLQGQTGAAFIATRAGVPVLPLVVYGQEEVGRGLRRLCRVPVKVRVGTPLNLPVGRIGTHQLEECTEKIMLALARLLPERYRGVYAEAAVRDSNGASALAATGDASGPAKGRG